MLIYSWKPFPSYITRHKSLSPTDNYLNVTGYLSFASAKIQMTPQRPVASSTLFLVLQDEDTAQHRHATDTIHLLVEYIYIYVI